MNELLGKKLGEYFVVEEIARGSVATVYKAHQPSQDRHVALKVLPPYFAHEAAIADRFITEASALTKLEHPNILRLYDFGIEEGQAFLAFELAGESLRAKLGQPLGLEFTADILSQLAAALDYAHAQGILHKDVKPSNIFLDANGTARLADFAVCMDVEGLQSFAKSGVFLPAPEYVSPELAEGYKVDGRNDIYSLGILLFQMVTGELPFTAYTPFNVLIKQLNRLPPYPSSVDPTLPATVDEVILKALSKNPRDRYDTAEEMASAFQQAIKEGRREADLQVSVMADGGGSQTLAGAGVGVAVEEVPKPSLVCPACGMLQREGAKYCPRCWILLSPERFYVPKPRMFTRRWLSEWVTYHKLWTAIIVVVLLALAWSAPDIVNSMAVKEFKPPSTNITADSDTDSWPISRGNNAQTAYVENIPKAPKGKLKWTFPLGSPAGQSAVVADGKVYVATSSAKVYAVDAETGQLKWEYKTTGPVDATPAAAGDFVYVGLRDARLLALDANTGEKKWEFRAGNPIYSPPNVYGGVVYIGTADSHLYALDAATGEKLWDYKTGGWIDGSPAVGEGYVAACSRDGRLYVFDQATGAKRFEYHSPTWLESSPIISEGLIYMPGTDGLVRAVDPTVKPGPLEPFRYFWVNFYVWGLPIPPPPPPPGYLWGFEVQGSLLSSLALAHDALYFGAPNGKVYAIKTADGSQVWEYKTGGPIFSSPAIGGDTLYIGSDDGKLYALDISSGAERWSFLTDGKITASPALAGGVLFISSEDGNLYAIE